MSAEKSSSQPSGGVELPQPQVLGEGREATSSASASATPPFASAKGKSKQKSGTSPTTGKRKQLGQAVDKNDASANGRESRLVKKESYLGDDVIDVPTPNVSSGEEDSDGENNDELGDMVSVSSSKHTSKQELLERKATLEPEFMRMLTIPDERDESEAESKLFETNQNTMPDQNRGSSFAVPRKTGFESWLRSKTSARQLYNAENEGKPLLVFKNLGMEVKGSSGCVPKSIRHRFQNFFRECLDLGIDDTSKQFTILKSVSGVMTAGKTTLVLGPPGAGSTSLLRLLSGRTNPREAISFDVLRSFEDGEINPTKPLMRRRCVFVSSDDRAHLPTLTVRETMEFAAQLTMPWKQTDTPTEREVAMDELVTRVVESLGLSEQCNTIIGGDDLRGVSGGQKRRCSLGEMLFSRDAKLLFLDDVSNGLDSSKAQQVMRIIRSACRVLGFAAFVSLLQPNDMLFDAFDDVLVLSPSGEMAFSGPVAEAVPYFEALMERVNEESTEIKDWTRPSGMSAGEYILMAVSTLASLFASKPELGSLSERFSKSRDGEKLMERVKEAQTIMEHDKCARTSISRYATSSWNQFKVLTKRKALLVSRNPMTVRRILVAIAFGIVIGTLFSSLDNGMMGSLARAGFIFLTLFLVFMLSTAVTVPDNHALRLVFYKQHGAAFHSVVSFYLSNLVCEFPLAVVEALLLSIIPYWWVGMRTSDAGGFFYFFAVLLAMEMVGQASSRLISALSPTVAIAQLFASGYILLCGLMGGFMPHYKNIPPWWQWMNWLNPIGYAFEGLILNNYMAGGQASASFPILVVEVNGTTIDLGSQSGADVSSSLGAPRVPFNRAPMGLNDPGEVMAFDFGMLLVFACLLDLCALVALKKSHDWYEPWSRRSIQTTSNSSTVDEVRTIFDGIKSQFLALKQEEFGGASTTAAEKQQLADPVMTASTAGGESEHPDLLSKTQERDVHLLAPVTLSIVDVSYFVKDPSYRKKAKQEEAQPADVPSPESPDDKEESQPKLNKPSTSTPSKNGFLSGIQDVFRLSNPHRSGEELRFSFMRFYSACLFRLNCCGSRKRRPQPGLENTSENDSDMLPPEERIQLTVHRPRSGSKRGRAWSNKLPLGEEEDVGPDGCQAEEIQLLHSVTAYFRSGEMTALMGQSGCGKSTLMDVVAGYKTEGRIRGDVFINGVKPEPHVFRRLLGYAEQIDLHISTLSVYESLLFAASCRLPRSYSQTRIVETVNKVMTILQLEEFRDVIVGDEDASEGLPKHARKRLTIGVELVAEPRILFLDEPTTGLDSLGAEIVTDALAKAKKVLNLCVIATIHQPSRAVFGRFDRLLFLQRGGYVLYHGYISSFRPFSTSALPLRLAHVVESTEKMATEESEDDRSGSNRDWMQVHVIQRQPSGLQPIDENNLPSIVVADMRPAPTIADTVLAYFAGLGAPPLKQGFNPADHLLLAVDTLEENGVDIADLYEESKEKKQVWDVIAKETKQPQPLPVIEPGASFVFQLGLLSKRYFLSQWRDPRIFFFRMAWFALTGLFLGTTFFRLGCSVNDVVYRIAALFFAVYAAVIPMQVAVVPLVKERAVVYREHISGTYSAWADGISRFLVDIPFHAASAVLFFAIYYYAVSLSTVPEKTGYFILMIFFTFWTLTSFGQVAALLSPNVETANGLAGLVVLLSTFLMGFLIPVKLMPSGWRWAVWINMLYYILQGLCVNELGGEYLQLDLGNKTLPCSPPQIVDIEIQPILPFRRLEETDSRFLESLKDHSAVQPELFLQDDFMTKFALRGSGMRDLQGNDNQSFVLPCQDQFEELASNFTSFMACYDHCERSIIGVVPCLGLNCRHEISGLILATENAFDCLPPVVQRGLERVLPCLIANRDNPDGILHCFPLLEKLIEFFDKYMPVIVFLIRFFRSLPAELLTWLYYIVAYQVVYIPSNIVLWVFGWAHESPGQLGLVADTKWWYCMFALCMFLLGWEIIKLFARRYVVWVRR